MSERWADVSGYVGMYQVSDLGRVRSCERVVMRVDGKPLPVRERILRPARDRGGYLRVKLCDHTRETAPFVHHLVLEAFIGPCPDGMEALHNNGDPNDNRAANLRWGTHTENMADQRAHGTGPQGERHARATVTEADVVEMRRLRAAGLKLREIAERFGVRITCVTDIVLRRSWPHVP